MDSQHVRALIKPRLYQASLAPGGGALRVRRRKTEVTKRKHPAQCQVHGLTGTRGYGYVDYIRAEPCGRDGNLVTAGRQSEQTKAAVRIGLSFRQLTRCYVLDGNSSVGNGCSRWIGDRA